jgi:sulfide:quinone oxidoreductase
VTPEPFPGHLGLGGLTDAAHLLQEQLQRRQITVRSAMALESIEPGWLTLSGGDRLPQTMSVIIPGFRGRAALQTSGLSHHHGFLPRLPNGQHPENPHIYPVGVAADLGVQARDVPIPLSLPKTGEMAEAMAVAAAHNIANRLLGRDCSDRTPTFETVCLADFGDTGLLYVAAPILPDPVSGQRRFTRAIVAPWVVAAKQTFEAYFLTKLRLGLAVPAVEHLGLRWLLGVELTHSLTRQ